MRSPADVVGRQTRESVDGDGVGGAKNGGDDGARMKRRNGDWSNGASNDWNSIEWSYLFLKL